MENFIVFVIKMKAKCPECGYEFNFSEQRKQTILTTLKKPKRFNELHRQTGLSKPYLLELLKELECSHLINRRVVSKQKVVYSLEPT